MVTDLVFVIPAVDKLYFGMRFLEPRNPLRKTHKMPPDIVSLYRDTILYTCPAWFVKRNIRVSHVFIVFSCLLREFSLARRGKMCGVRV
jgi:hypothetical protein